MVEIGWGCSDFAHIENESRRKRPRREDDEGIEAAPPPNKEQTEERWKATCSFDQKSPTQTLWNASEWFRVLLDLISRTEDAITKRMLEAKRPLARSTYTLINKEWRSQPTASKRHTISASNNFCHHGEVKPISRTDKPKCDFSTLNGDIFEEMTFDTIVWITDR